MTTDSPTTPRRSVWKKLAFALFVTVVIVFLGIEVLSRIADGVVAGRKQDPASGVKSDDYVPDLMARLSIDVLEYGTVKRSMEQTGARNQPHPYLGYSLVPNYRSAPGATQQVSHNSLGFRGKETTWEKPPGTYRILTTGGSSVYGQSETSDAMVWSQQLEDKLNAALPGRKFEVVNTGCSGWSSFEMLVNLEMRGLEFSPDLVIVYEAINDTRCALYTRGGEPTPDNRHWRATWPVDRPSAIESWLTSSRTYMVGRRYLTDYAARRADLGFYAITNFDPSPKADDPYVHYAKNLPIPERGFTNYRRNLSDMVSVCAGHGVKILFVTQALPRWHLDPMPSRREHIDAFDRIQNIEREVAAERNVPVFECARIVEKAVDEELAAEVARQRAAKPTASDAEIQKEARRIVRTPGLGLMKAEVHPNDSGSELIARLIAEYLMASPLLSESH